MGGMSGGNCYMNNHIISQQVCDSNNGDVSSGYTFINSHTLFKYNDWSTFKEMERDVEKGGVSSQYGSTNRHNLYQYNGLK